MSAGFFFSSRRRHTRWPRDWSSDVCSSDLGFRGISGVIGGSVYTILAFGGFEGAAPLAEEAKTPRRTIPRAVMLATLLIGALYVFTTSAVDVAYGPAKFG